MASENITLVRLPIEVDKMKETKIIAMKGDQFAGKTTAAILQLYVVPHMRKRGIGSMLVNKAIEIAQMHGCEAVGLSLAASNYLAWKLYKSLGFIRGYQYDDGSWLVQLEASNIAAASAGHAEKTRIRWTARSPVGCHTSSVSA